MSRPKGNVLKDAIADVAALKEAAEQGAQKVLKEHFKNGVKTVVENALNEMDYDCDEKDEDDMAGDDLEENLVGGQDHLDMDYPIGEGLDDLDFDLGADEEEEEEEDEDLEEGYSEAELEEAVMAALQEVDHGALGDMEIVAAAGDPDGAPADSKGLEKLDKGEAGWEEKTPPKGTQATIHGGGTYHEGKKARAKLALENAALKKQVSRQAKAIKKLYEAVEQQKTFHAKLLNTHRLLQTEGLSVKMKRSIVKQMDEAKTVAEANTTYNIFKEAISTIGGKAQKQHSLQEALGSGITETPGVDKDSLLLESTSPFDVGRMQRLAGIKK